MNTEREESEMQTEVAAETLASRSFLFLSILDNRLVVQEYGEIGDLDELLDLLAREYGVVCQQCWRSLCG